MIKTKVKLKVFKDIEKYKNSWVGWDEDDQMLDYIGQKGVILEPQGFKKNEVIYLVAFEDGQTWYIFETDLEFL